MLPPVAKLNPGEAIYHFLSGYTAKVAGTERGIDEPVATFSTCFGAAFMTLHPTVYADLLQKKLDTHGTNCYLVNSGWAGGPYGEGERMSIRTTRTCIDAILDGSIERAEFKTDPNFELAPFFDACMSGDEATKNAYHQQYFSYTLDYLKGHVDSTLADLDRHLRWRLTENGPKLLLKVSMRGQTWHKVSQKLS